METIGEQEKENKKVTEVKTFSVPFSLEEIKVNINIVNNKVIKYPKEEIINQALIFHSQGNITEAAKYYQYLINQGLKDYRIFSNYGTILKNLGKLKEAEIFQRKAIQEKPDFAMSYYNLGNVLHALGKLKDAEATIEKSIELNPNYANSHCNLGLIMTELGKLKEAELSLSKSIEIRPDLVEAHYNLGNTLRDLGRLKEAEISYRKAIKLNPEFLDCYLNLGNILKGLGKLKDAEIITLKAIKLKPDYANAHCNLGGILRNLGKLKEAEISYRKAIKLNPDLAKAYYSLSILKCSGENKIWQDKLFSRNILNNKSRKDKIDIYFARANILHRKKNYNECTKYLKLANNLKLDIHASKSNIMINKTRNLLIESNKQKINKKIHIESPQSIFIVGMPRSGSTLLESILSMNKETTDLGEINILEESFIEVKRIDQGLTLAELYWKKAHNYNNKLKATTNKWLYNYQYAGIIACGIPNAKIIHCFRNPLDNILSIYRTYFAQGNQYSSSIVDCAQVYLDQEEIMTEYKNRFRSKIYDLNYDLLVSNPNKVIQSLISWLGWQWDDSYLTHHLNPRAVSTASSVQVRSPIHSKSIDGWKNYIEILRPAIGILEKAEKYKNLRFLEKL
tara:strand:- start:288 stop:2156 length:1869 start_codon:yes stop_codon:yes gene_type:complete